jgi:hypothetical protein
MQRIVPCRQIIDAKTAHGYIRQIANRMEIDWFRWTRPVCLSKGAIASSNTERRPGLLGDVADCAKECSNR